jgi:hypothetical protein
MRRFGRFWRSAGCRQERFLAGFLPGADRPGQPEFGPKNTPKVIFIAMTLVLVLVSAWRHQR